MNKNGNIDLKKILSKNPSKKKFYGSSWTLKNYGKNKIYKDNYIIHKY